jgi:hypothetical protein
MNDVPASDSGLASGMVNTSFMMGGALGLAVFASLAAATTQQAAAQGANAATALNTGYHLAFVCGAGAAICAALIGLAAFRNANAASAQAGAGGHAM